MYCTHCGTQVPDQSSFCHVCGKPPVRAAAAPPAGASIHPMIIVVIVLGGLMVVVAIIGIIAAIAIPNMLNAINRGRQKRTLADMRVIANATESWAVDHGHYPDADSIAGLADFLEPEYVSSLPRNDGWRNAFTYQCWQERPESEGCDNYIIASAARDMAFELSDLRAYAGDSSGTRDFDCDIVYHNGAFIQSPEGIRVE